MREITLQYSTKVALVSDQDFEEISKYKWLYASSRNSEYAYTRINKKCVYMHKLLLNSVGWNQVDHIDSNGLNNQRENIRPCSYQQNQMNRPKGKTGTSKHKGVYFHKSRGKWMARLELDNKTFFLGYHSTEDEAAQAYNKAAQVYFKEFARLNAI